MYNILICDDDKYIVKALKIYLDNPEYNIFEAFNGKEALEIIGRNEIHLVLMDIMMPVADGLQTAEKIREKYNMPIIFLTAKSEDNDKITGLEVGGDDYITKPFDTSELLARVEVVLRRFNKNISTLIVDDIEIDLNSRTVKKNGVVISLTLKEYELLVLFLRNKNIALYRETIYERVWHENFMGDTRTVDLHVQRLRKKMHLENRIVSVYKVGYRYEELKR